MNTMFYSQEQPIRRIGCFKTAFSNSIASMMYFTIGSWITSYESHSGQLISLIGGAFTGFLFGLVGSILTQNLNESFELRLQKRFLLELLIQLSSICSIPMGLFASQVTDIGQLTEMIKVQMIGHLMLVGIKSAIILGSLAVWSFRDYPAYYHTHLMFLYICLQYLEQGIVPVVEPERLPEAEAHIVSEVLEAELVIEEKDILPYV